MKRLIPKCAAGSRRAGTAGFTLAEMMFGTAIGAIVMAGAMTTYVISLRGFSAISNYAEIHRGGRTAVNWLAKDLCSVYSISSFSTNGPVVVLIPTAYSSSGSVISNKTVTYSVSATCLKRTDSLTGKTSTLATNINQITFTLYDHVGTNTSVLASAKGIQVDIKLRKTVGSRAQTEDFLSARMNMRNIP